MFCAEVVDRDDLSTIQKLNGAGAACKIQITNTLEAFKWIAKKEKDPSLTSSIAAPAAGTPPPVVLPAAAVTPKTVKETQETKALTLSFVFL